jgi:hypothetical protein
MTMTRRVIVTILLIFVVYAIVTSPGPSADVVRNAVDQLGEWLGNLGEFVDKLIAK